MRTLHFGVRVLDRERSLAFYRALGYQVVGEPEGFIIEGDAGQLREGERDRARAWAAETARRVAHRAPTGRA